LRRKFGENHDYFSKRSAMKSAATVIGFSDAEHAEILEWYDEFDGPCSESRRSVLASKLGGALEGYMDIEREILSCALLADYRRRQMMQTR
jgi:hypothetical protein